MILSDHVHVARRFQRSIRIDTDLYDPMALEGFVCPRSSAEVLLTMARHITETGQAAFTWTGPYGSGKSSLVIALSALLNGNAILRDQAAAIIGKGIADTIWKALPPKQSGWRILPVIGQRTTPSEVIGNTLVELGYLGKKDVPCWTDDQIIATLSQIASENNKKFGGMIVFIDEMGKFLEGAAQEGVDIYLFQRLAEAATRSKQRLIVIGILHQTFDEYTQRIARDQRDEWAKVQGRFVDLMVNTAGDEQLDLIARAIQSDRSTKAISPLSHTVAKLIRSGRPNVADNIDETLENCWPLHPVVACLLGPLSRRRFGQNQRSIFGFLNSAEPIGFQDFLRNATDTDIFGPDRLWDYLRINLEHTILASPDGHRWSMAVEAIERCEAMGASLVHLQLLKTIALMDLFRERSGLSATLELLSTCIPESMGTEKLKGALKQLQTWSFIIYRKHLHAYAIHAGSDFDIDQALTETLETIREVNFRELRMFAGLQPILAKRHYHKTGALRWFDVDILPLKDISIYASTERSVGGAIGCFLLVLPTENETKPKASNICESVVNQSSQNIILGLSSTSWRVLQLAREFIAINKINEERSELSGDPIARREVLAILADVRARLETDLQKMFDTAIWYRSGAGPTRYNYSKLNSLASDIADKYYSQAPQIHNELLNRKKPSSNAIAAQRALLKLMVKFEGEPRLTIQGFPAEGGLFESILLNTGLYRGSKQGWRFTPPSEGKDPCGLLPAWNAANQQLIINERPVAMDEIYSLWKKSPFGIKEGLLPILGVAFILAQRNLFAFYREGIFQASFTDLDIDFLTNDPTSIQLRWMNLSTQSKKILSDLAAIVREIDGGNRLVHLEPIDVARGLVGIHNNLKPWAKRTNRLSANALHVRTLFKQASDPNKFLFDDIPKLFGKTNIKTDETQIGDIIRKVCEGLLELTQSYSGMLDRLQQIMLIELQVPNTSPRSLAELRARAENIRQLTGDFRLNAFVGRLSQFTCSEEDMEGIASLATNKPPRDWVDADFDQAAVEIADLTQKFLRSEAYAHVKGRPDKRHAMAVIVGLNGHPVPMMSEFSIKDTDRNAVENVISRVEHVLSGSKKQDRDIILAALAELSTRYM